MQRARQQRLGAAVKRLAVQHHVAGAHMGEQGGGDCRHAAGEDEPGFGALVDRQPVLDDLAVRVVEPRIHQPRLVAWLGLAAPGAVIEKVAALLRRAEHEGRGRGTPAASPRPPIAPDRSRSLASAFRDAECDCRSGLCDSAMPAWAPPVDGNRLAEAAVHQKTRPVGRLSRLQHRRQQGGDLRLARAAIGARLAGAPHCLDGGRASGAETLWQMQTGGSGTWPSAGRPASSAWRVATDNISSPNRPASQSRGGSAASGRTNMQAARWPSDTSAPRAIWRAASCTVMHAPAPSVQARNAMKASPASPSPVTLNGPAPACRSARPADAH